MSFNQPCLPVPKQKKGKRKRKSNDNGRSNKAKIHGSRTNGHNGNGNGNDGNPSNASVSFAKIETMDAATYMSLVTKEASLLPISSYQIDEGSLDTKGMGTSPNNITGTDKSTSSKKTEGFVAIDGAAASLQYLTSNRASLTPVPSTWHLPPSSLKTVTKSSTNSDEDTPSWINSCLTNFDNLRQYLKDCQMKGVGGKQDPKRQAVPPMKDQDSWWKFCLGWKDDSKPTMLEATGDIPKNRLSAKDENEADMPGLVQSENNVEPDDTPLWALDLPANGFPPTVRVLLQMDQVMVRKVIAHLGVYVHTMAEQQTIHLRADIDDNPAPPNATQQQQQQRAMEWLYGLLARIETPIHRDDAAVLYSLLKYLTKLRAVLRPPTQSTGTTVDVNSTDNNGGKTLQNNNYSTEKSNRNRLSQYNTLIVVIGMYFDQGGDRVMKCDAAM